MGTTVPRPPGKAKAGPAHGSRLPPHGAVQSRPGGRSERSSPPPAEHDTCPPRPPSLVVGYEEQAEPAAVRGGRGHVELRGVPPAAQRPVDGRRRLLQLADQTLSRGLPEDLRRQRVSPLSSLFPHIMHSGRVSVSGHAA